MSGRPIYLWQGSSTAENVLRNKKKYFSDCSKRPNQNSRPENWAEASATIGERSELHYHIVASCRPLFNGKARGAVHSPHCLRRDWAAILSFVGGPVQGLVVQNRVDVAGTGSRRLCCRKRRLNINVVKKNVHSPRECIRERWASEKLGTTPKFDVGLLLQIWISTLF